MSTFAFFRPARTPTVRFVLALAVAVGVSWAPSRLHGQVAPSGAGVTLPSPSPVSPMGAFLRAIAVPGWGHAALGSYGRGGFYFAAQSATTYGIVKTRLRLAEAHRRADLREASLRAQARERGIEEGEELQAIFDGDEALEDLTLLIDAREQQQEDWVALGVFLVLLSGADAFVSAHLQNFPEPLELNASTDGAVEFGLRIPVGR